ncbi:hypothetical protein GCM10007989_33670 [Devosia pacifica]|uniref:Uncharacterized protein n=1 Tax=Devosia pacifica TaxID=1335967 RepID=A0A918VY91_9HYPH|nr:hypothetical protein [Devosia pacifica]GHA35018.1 hypothetical protein GCM10007989_33670 [Devosia pacifica]
MSKHVVLPDEREAKLKQIAAKHEITVAEAVGLLIEWAVEHEKVEPGIPGIEIRRDTNNVVIDFGVFRRTYSLEVAKAFSVALRWYARPKGTQFSDILDALSGSEIVGLSRRGTSVKVAGPNGAERTLAPSVARELATLIERSTAQLSL